MELATLNRMSTLISDESAQIIRNWADRVMSLPHAGGLTRPALIDHMPQLIDQLAEVVRKNEELVIDTDPSNGNGSSEAHGSIRFQEGFDIVEVVAEYNALREVLLDFAQRQESFNKRISRIVNRTLDHAIAFAVKAYATQRACELQRRRQEYLSFLVHDLKTPLSAIETATYLLDLKSANSGGAPNKLLSVVRRNAARLNSMITELLSESVQLQPDTAGLEKREFDVWPAVEGLIRDLHPLADKNQTTISNEIPLDLTVFADARALCRVFQNLVSNSIKHTRSGIITIGGRPAEGQVEFWVRDSGDGIPSERLGKIFDKLETNDADDGGSGLGLAIVREIVEAHGGRVAVDTAAGQGATFTFTIPAAV